MPGSASAAAGAGGVDQGAPQQDPAQATDVRVALQAAMAQMPTWQGYLDEIGSGVAKIVKQFPLSNPQVAQAVGDDIDSLKGDLTKLGLEVVKQSPTTPDQPQPVAMR